MLSDRAKKIKSQAVRSLNKSLEKKAKERIRLLNKISKLDAKMSGRHRESTIKKLVISGINLRKQLRVLNVEINIMQTARNKIDVL